MFWKRKERAEPPGAPAAPGKGFADLFGQPPEPGAQPQVEPLTEAPPPPDRPRTVAPPAESAVLDAWAMDETAFWRLNPCSGAAMAASWKSLNETSRSIFLYRFAEGGVDVLPKSDALAHGEAALERSREYLAFFRTLLPLLPADFEVTLALETNDRLVQAVDVPVFCFQKQRGERSILLPDIDFLLHDFYLDSAFQDRLAYADKIRRAIFVGSTSGGTVTPEVARTAGLPRLRAARFFAGHDRVEFLLPQIVQTSNDEARALLAAMPFCQAPTMSWQEQFMRRFLLSIDGNGATCSRVAIALRSLGVLLKYESDHLLYYFRGLQPWLHYVPVSRDEDLDRIIDMEAAQPVAFETISRNARNFAATYLSRNAASRYTVRLLLLYQACLSGMPAETGALPVAAAVPAPVTRAFLLAHVENQGDTQAGPDGWVGRPGSGLTIEGFPSLSRNGKSASASPAGYWLPMGHRASPWRAAPIAAREAATSRSMVSSSMRSQGLKSRRQSPTRRSLPMASAPAFSKPARPAARPPAPRWRPCASASFAVLRRRDRQDCGEWQLSGAKESKKVNHEDHEGHEEEIVPEAPTGIKA